LRIVGPGWVAFGALAVAMFAFVSWGQHGGRTSAPTAPSQQSTPGANWPGAGPPPIGDANSPEGIRQNEQLMKARNSQRQEQLMRDTNKLLQLATELKAQVDQTNKDVLSVDVVKKAEQIEKLAKSVKEKMRQ
jgi:hypothetical protein